MVRAALAGPLARVPVPNRALTRLGGSPATVTRAGRAARAVRPGPLQLSHTSAPPGPEHRVNLSFKTWN